MKPSTELMMRRYKRHRFPAEFIAHAVWLYYRFPLSLRHVEDLLAERGKAVWFQTVSEWAPQIWSRICPAHSAALQRVGAGYV